VTAPQVTIVGGGMITQDQLLPSFYHLQRLGLIGEINVCALNSSALRVLAEAFATPFPGQSFRAYPDLSVDPAIAHPDLYLEVIGRMPPRNIVMVALPDQLHYPAIMAAIKADQHVLSVKPLVLNAAQAHTIGEEAHARGLFVGIEYHKRFDDRSLMARSRYRAGMFGEFRLGTACLLEKWYYRHSNFQHWCTVENSDAFTYIGCHYVDLVHFITGLQPVAVSLFGIRDRYPNGNEGFLWTDARVRWSNGACLNVQNALGFPDSAPGTNTQSLTMYCAGGENGALISHSDQYRGLKYAYTGVPQGAGATQYAEPSPDYFQYLDLGGPGLTPVGYGYRSVEHLTKAVLAIERDAATLEQRQRALDQIDATGIIATPRNSHFNERVIEAARKSILNGGAEVAID
jgi:D-galacturonate reductase